MKTIQILGLMSVVFTSFIYPNAYAQETTLKPKSVTTAWILALDPVPADALLYAQRPVQGTIDGIVGVLGGWLFWGSLASLLTCHNPSEDSPCGYAGVTMMFGAAIYFPALLWDGIGGVHYVKKQNADIERANKSSFLGTFQPTLALERDGVIAGAQFRF